MCFQEHLGYTCGHSSLAVLRPCPLTTQEHKFPVCTSIAARTILAGIMCPSCQRLINTRATMIEEYEHRFMHERNVCGCKVQFPDLIRPRLIGPANQDFRLAEPDAVTAYVPPVFVEGHFRGTEAISIRQPSLFGAEWLADHRVLHELGHCDCRADFRTYQQVMAAGTSQGDAIKAEFPAAEAKTHYQAIHPQVQALTAEATAHHQAIHAPVQAPVIASSSAYHPNDGDQPRPHSASQSDQMGNVAGQLSGSTTFSPGGTYARSATAGETVSGVSSTLYDTSSESPLPLIACTEAAAKTILAQIGATPAQLQANVDNGITNPPASQVDGSEDRGTEIPSPQVHPAGAVFPQVPGHLVATAPFLIHPSPLTQVDPTAGAIGMQMFNFTPHTIPLVGLPIGAGPEQISHAGPWEGCDLHPMAWKTASST